MLLCPDLESHLRIDALDVAVAVVNSTFSSLVRKHGVQMVSRFVPHIKNGLTESVSQF